jgi:hypothetical protein
MYGPSADLDTACATRELLPQSESGQWLTISAT